MPAYNRAVSSDTKKSDTSANLPHLADTSVVADQDTPRVGKKKTKHAAAKQLSNFDNADKTSTAEEMDQPPLSSARPQTILGQLDKAFPQSRKNGLSDTLNGLNTTQKVSDVHTPPMDIWARSPTYGRSPPGEPIPGTNTPGSPPYEPGFSSRGGFNTRSPPMSPPLRKSRPVSYGNGIPPLPIQPRASTSPYGYAINAYGSPPALPHLPQQHFYGPHDVDLGLAQAATHLSIQEPVALKFAHIPGYGHDNRETVLLASDGDLSILGFTGEKLEHIGALTGVQGTIVDACLMTWSSGEDPFAEYRPLVALAIHGTGNAEPDSPMSRYPNMQDYQAAFPETKVVVCSVSKSCQIAELLRVPSTIRTYPGGIPGPGQMADLKVQASGNFIIASSGDSGEIFVFAIRKGKDSAVFECLGKYWTTIQLPTQRRDSSIGPSSDADVSPADLGRGPESEKSPILSLNGRWLAFCPISTSSQRSIGAILGDFVVHNKNSTINAGTPPSRPQVTCDVESPDVETFLTKVAKGFAQEAVRSAKWIGEKGMQTWQNYWKRDATSPHQPAVTSSSPPVYSPYLGVTQFPPTHAIDQPNFATDPEVVTILDLKLLQETQGRKGVELSPMATFQPPGGCSFLSFTPTGLGLLTANRKGDVQYVWDLLQIKHVNIPRTSAPTESGRVRQIARYERLSSSTIVDLVWDGPTGYRFALLTKNRTVHIFDLPKTALQWPPPLVKKHRPTSAPVDPPQAKKEHEPAPPGGFLASAMSIAGRTQPMLANLRGRTPSISGGITGFGASGIGLASTTGIKSGRAVAAGLSKSLGAATETVTNLRHANQSRLYLKTAARVGMLSWQRRDGKSVLSILELSSIKNYYVRMTKPRENRHRETVSVFDARKAVASKLPRQDGMVRGYSHTSSNGRQDEGEGPTTLSGFWKIRATREGGVKMPHPLASAEIETNVPYQPFHSDRRVTMSLIPDDQSFVGNHFPPSSSTFPTEVSAPQARRSAESDDKWVFGTEIRTQRMTAAIPSQPFDEHGGSVIYRETKITSEIPTFGAAPIDGLEDGISHIVSNTKKRKNKKNRLQAQITEDDDSGEAGMDFAPRDRGLDQEFNLLESEDRV